MIKLVSSHELSLLCEFEKCIILVTDDFAGHRLDWLNELSYKVAECGLKLFVIALDLNRVDSRFYERNGGPIFCSDFSNRSEVIKFIDSNFKCFQTVAFWDAELWIKELLKLRFRSQLLFMRPYVSDLSLKSSINFLLKLCSMFYFKHVRGHSLGLLAVPLNRRFFFNRDQVSDELILGKFHVPSSRTNLNRINAPIPKSMLTIIVPGYISMRKNPFLVIEVGKRLATTTDLSFRIIFQGKVDEEIEGRLKSQAFDWLSVNDEYVTLEDFLELINQSTIVLLPYSNRGSSGIVLQAQYLGKRVILSKNRLWSNEARSSKGTIVLSRLSVNSITKSILDICNSPESHRNSDEKLRETFTAFKFLMGQGDVRK